MVYFVENKEKVIERWDKLELCKGLKGDLDEIISKLYEYR
jgi:hypothetical protein